MTRVLIGYAMIALLFAALFAAMAWDGGWQAALAVFGSVVAFVGWVVLAAWLIAS